MLQAALGQADFFSFEGQGFFLKSAAKRFKHCFNFTAAKICSDIFSFSTFYEIKIALIGLKTKKRNG